MSSLLEGDERLERELIPERLTKPAVGSFVLHGGLIAFVAAWGLLGGLFHGHTWGNAGPGSAIQVSLVSNALPLPSTQPINNNVLATDTPSQAPAVPTPKAKQAVDQNAIPILGKQTKPRQQTTQRTPQSKAQPQPNYKAQYGEQAGSSMPHAMQTPGSNGPVATPDSGDFGSLFGWYVNEINVKVQQNWYKGEIDPRTPRGARVYLTFIIGRDGSPSQVQIDRASGSYTLDQSCLRAVQRVDTFGNLPSAYNSNTLRVSYYCEY